MTKIETRAGSRVVISLNNRGTWISRLYVSGGETATLVSANHKSEAGARKWAQNTLAGF